MDGANLVLAARLEEDRTGSAWADAARLGTGISRAARLATGGDAARLATGRRGSATQKRAARLHTRARLTHGCTRARVEVPESGARRFGSRGGSSVGPLRARLRLPDRGWRGGCWWSGYRGFARRRLQTCVSAALASDRSGATRLADGLAADARRWLRLGFGVRETAAPTDARLLDRLGRFFRRGWKLGDGSVSTVGSAALLNREGRCLAARVRGGGGGGVRRLGFQ